jgi:hypothetical protein
MSLRSMDAEAVPVRKKMPRDGQTYSCLRGLPRFARNDRVLIVITKQGCCGNPRLFGMTQGR